MKSIEIKINNARGEFIYGNCATLAIGGAFDIHRDYIDIMFTIMGINPNNGVTHNECKKLINIIAKFQNYKIEYYPNKPKLAYWQLVLLNPKGKFIVDMGNHLSYFENGELYDSYLMENKQKIHKKFTGWWKIS